MDIGILLHSSLTMKAHNYESLKRSLSKLVDYFDVSENGTHFGFIHYNQDAFIDFALSDASLYNPVTLKAKIQSVPYDPGLTRTDKALKRADEELFSTKGEARNDVPKVLLVVTDADTMQGSEPYSQVLGSLKVYHSLGYGVWTSPHNYLSIHPSIKRGYFIYLSNYLTIYLSNYLTI